MGSLPFSVDLNVIMYEFAEQGFSLPAFFIGCAMMGKLQVHRTIGQTKQLLTTCQPIPCQFPKQHCLLKSLMFFVCFLSYGMKYLPDQFRSAVVVLFPPASQPPHWQVQHERLKNTCLNVETTKIVVCYQHCFLLNPKHGIISTTVKKINSIPVKTRTTQDPSLDRSCSVAPPFSL